MEALISQSTRRPMFASADRCRVISGRWVSPYTGNVIQDASQIDVDHIVPLKFAWEHGADSWSQQKREQFSNNPVNLWSVEAGLNRSKGAQSPTEWLPPSGQCQYISRFLRIIKLYNLQLGAEETPQYETLKGGCEYRSR
ncbi:HNH endonuclease family protein [Marinobacter sp. PE14]